jgi:hypothetical protein
VCEHFPPPPTRDPEPQRETRGRKRKWDWERAALAVFGQIYRGDVTQPKKQGQVEALLAEWFSANCGGEEPVESQIREHAVLIWGEIEAEN